MTRLIEIDSKFSHLDTRIAKTATQLYKHVPNPTVNAIWISRKLGYHTGDMAKDVIAVAKSIHGVKDDVSREV